MGQHKQNEPVSPLAVTCWWGLIVHKELNLHLMAGLLVQSGVNVLHQQLLLMLVGILQHQVTMYLHNFILMVGLVYGELLITTEQVV